jgi:hypothetical protein
VKTKQHITACIRNLKNIFLRGKGMIGYQKRINLIFYKMRGDKIGVKNMKKISKIKAGIIFGVIVGIIDVIPMIFLKLTWDANLSAFSMWVIAGFMISTSNLKINSVLKGILISFLLLIPSAVIIGWQQPTSLIPIFIMTIILGSLLGYFITFFGEK